MAVSPHPLAAYGWIADREAEIAGEPDLVPARVALQERGAYVLYTAAGEIAARVSGRFRHEIRRISDYPVAGDWVLVHERTIERVLPRRTAVSRQGVSNQAEEQVLAANVDVLFIVASLEDVNPRRLERYVVLARASGARAVLVLNKADRGSDVNGALEAIAAIPADIPRHVVSAVAAGGTEALASYLEGGRTVALIGPSGVGKSTLTNALTGTTRHATGEIRADGRGRHTTTRRELMVVPGRGLILDTPGLRELQLWTGDLDTAFTDVAALATRCRFADCTHGAEPGCAIRAAIAEGSLDQGRVDAQRKLERELAALDTRKDARAMAEQRRRWRVVNRHPKGPRGPV